MIDRKERSVGFWLGIGILFVPIIFSWFTLREGHTTKAKAIAFMWLVFVFLIALFNNESASDQQKIPPKILPESSATYQQINNEVGCHSKYSDTKKDDIFDAQYKNHWFSWTGQVQLSDSDNVSLNLDNRGIQDLKVYFEDKKAGYNLMDGEIITVRFVMKKAGGCFLPFSGRRGVIVSK